jgi:hypothetical protein
LGLQMALLSSTVENFPNTVLELHQDAFSVVQQLCDRTQLSVNPQKMVIVCFTWK